jgi:hypothetical protein
MGRLLPVPTDLQHLIEKRDSATDRRAQERRARGKRRSVDLGPLGSIESAKSLEEVSTEERRTAAERRKAKTRRTTARRVEAPKPGRRAKK